MTCLPQGLPLTYYDQEEKRVREIVLRDAMSLGLKSAIDERSIFLTPEHFLLPLLDDPQVCIVLAAVEVNPKVFTEMIKEYVDVLPRHPKRVAKPIHCWRIERILDRLRAKEQESRGSITVSGRHFIEAYAYEGATADDVQPIMPTLLLARRHAKIELAVYGELPKA